MRGSEGGCPWGDANKGPALEQRRQDERDSDTFTNDGALAAGAGGKWMRVISLASGVIRFASQGPGSTYNHPLIRNPPFSSALTGDILVFPPSC